MSYTVEQINHIVYNNRTFEGVTQNFLPKLDNYDILLLLEIEKQINFANKLINKNKVIAIDESKLDLDKEDITLLPHELHSIKVSSRNFSKEERELLDRKKIPKHIIEQYDISPLSQFKDIKTLEKLGVTTHPIFERLLGNEISEGLIIPLYDDNGKLINSVIRKTINLTKLKYGISVPSINLWGDKEWKGEELSMTEGLFDMMALKNEGLKCISSSSGSVNDFQYFKIIKGKPKRVNIFVDNDSSGYSSALKAQKVLGLNGIPTKTYASKIAKDMAEHFFELGLKWDDIEEINITMKMIENGKDNVFDFLKYLENRKF